MLFSACTIYRLAVLVLVSSLYTLLASVSCIDINLIFTCRRALIVKRKQGGYCIMYQLCLNLGVTFLVLLLTHLLYGTKLKSDD